MGPPKDRMGNILKKITPQYCCYKNDPEINSKDCGKYFSHENIIPFQLQLKG